MIRKFRVCIKSITRREEFCMGIRKIRLNRRSENRVFNWKIVAGIEIHLTLHVDEICGIDFAIHH